MAHQRCAIHKCRNLQRHLAQRYRDEAYQRLKTALAQMSYTEVRQMLLEIEAWLRAKNEFVKDSLLEAFEELLTLHRLKVPALLRETLMSTNPIESVFSLVRHSERNIKRTRGSTMLQRWLGAGLLSCEGQLKKVKGYARMVQVLAAITVEQAEQQPIPVKKAA
jgi:transposase-like protein